MCIRDRNNAAINVSCRVYFTCAAATKRVVAFCIRPLCIGSVGSWHDSHIVKMSRSACSVSVGRVKVGDDMGIGVRYTPRFDLSKNFQTCMWVFAQHILRILLK